LARDIIAGFFRSNPDYAGIPVIDVPASFRDIEGLMRFPNLGPDNAERTVSLSAKLVGGTTAGRSISRAVVKGLDAVAAAGPFKSADRGYFHVSFQRYDVHGVEHLLAMPPLDAAMRRCLRTLDADRASVVLRDRHGRDYRVAMAGDEPLVLAGQGKICVLSDKHPSLAIARPAK